MKVSSPVAAAALATLYAKEKTLVERSFHHLTGDALHTLDQKLLHEFNKLHDESDDATNGNDTRRRERHQQHHPIIEDLQHQHQPQEECHLILARACIRRIAHGVLGKYSQLVPSLSSLSSSSRQVMEDALKFHTLPLDLQEELATRYGKGGDDDDNDDDVVQSRPITWYEALEQLKTLATTTTATTTTTPTTTVSSSANDDDDDDDDDINCTPAAGSLDQGKLWRLICDHPMTSYVPVQCQNCGHVIPDQYPPRQTDAEVGLEEEVVLPTPPSTTTTAAGDNETTVTKEEDEITQLELQLRSGWFRGPRKAVVFTLTCTNCGSVSRWYRSGHPRIILNPHRWGRLCGEQEDLRLMLSMYLDVPVRLVVPLDWDHVWNEYLAPMPSSAAAVVASSSTSTGSTSPKVVWQVQDGNARNFRCRLDEGIGSWTRVFAIHTNADWCKDVTEEYLTHQRNGGRADDNNSDNVVERYEEMVRTARTDASGGVTQAKTTNGYLLARAKLSEEDVTRELQRAVKDYGTRQWWQLHG